MVKEHINHLKKIPIISKMLEHAKKGKIDHKEFDDILRKYYLVEGAIKYKDMSPKEAYKLSKNFKHKIISELIREKYKIIDIEQEKKDFSKIESFIRFLELYKDFEKAKKALFAKSFGINLKDVDEYIEKNPKEYRDFILRFRNILNQSHLSIKKLAEAYGVKAQTRGRKPKNKAVSSGDFNENYKLKLKSLRQQLTKYLKPTKKELIKILRKHREIEFNEGIEAGFAYLENLIKDAKLNAFDFKKAESMLKNKDSRVELFFRFLENYRNVEKAKKALFAKEYGIDFEDVDRYIKKAPDFYKKYISSLNKFFRDKGISIVSWARALGIKARGRTQKGVKVREGEYDKDYVNLLKMYRQELTKTMRPTKEELLKIMEKHRQIEQKEGIEAGFKYLEDIINKHKELNRLKEERNAYLELLKEYYLKRGMADNIDSILKKIKERSLEEQINYLNSELEKVSSIESALKDKIITELKEIKNLKEYKETPFMKDLEKLKENDKEFADVFDTFLKLDPKTMIVIQDIFYQVKRKNYPKYMHFYITRVTKSFTSINEERVVKDAFKVLDKLGFVHVYSQKGKDVYDITSKGINFIKKYKNYFIRSYNNWIKEEI